MFFLHTVKLVRRLFYGGFYKLALTDFRISFEGRVSADEGA